MSTKPWDHDKRSQVKRKIDKEAARAAARLGAQTVCIIAFFKDGEYMHMLDGGNAPMDFQKLYATLQTAHQTVEESGGKDVAIQ